MKPAAILSLGAMLTLPAPAGAQRGARSGGMHSHTGGVMRGGFAGSRGGFGTRGLRGFSSFGRGFDSFRHSGFFRPGFFHHRFFHNGFFTNGSFSNGFFGDGFLTPAFVGLPYFPFDGYYSPFDSYAGYGGYGYGGYGGYGYPGYAPADRVYVERQVVIVPPGGYADRGPAPEAPEEKKDPSEESAPSPSRGKDSYYLARPQPVESLAHALSDIRHAWLNGDPARLRDRVTGVDTVRIFPDGRFRSTMSGDEFARLVRDAMSRMETKAFDFDPASDARAERVLVTGRHSFVVPGNDPAHAATVYVSYGLVRRDGVWRIVEAGSSSKPIHTHETSAR